MATPSGRVSNASLQPASQDSGDADTVATADCSRWRPVSAPQPWWAMEPCESGRRSSTDGGRRVRARTAPRMNDDASSSSQLPGGSPGGRPTAAERAEALSVIRQMKESEPPILSCRGAPPKPNVVACAIALQLNEPFRDDTAAKRLFNVGAHTNVRSEWVDGCTVRGVWVDGKLKRLAAHENAARGAPVPPLYPRTPRARPQPLTDPSPVPHQSALSKPGTRLARSGCSSSSAREIGRTSCVQSGWPHERWRTLDAREVP